MNGWTPERRLRQSQLIHQWKPWKKSTGAKTLAGKTVSKMNAYKEGQYCADIRNAKQIIRGHEIMLLQMMKSKSKSHRQK